ncbi:MAG: Endo-1,4-beta-xylanase A precursor [Firmicutes bacterium ADurb.Bin193]|nr:MAG: Endo-1,4-beta-xylanase A precursor [Firmicutes bacterium ADurb.Bin193]
MHNRFSRMAALLVSVWLVLGGAAAASAIVPADLNAAIDDTATYICKTVSNPQVGSIGGEWAVLGLSRSGCDVPERYYQDYYKTVEAYVTACGGILHPKKYTEYSRVIVALASIGKDPGNVAGYNLLLPLADYDKTIWQGLNGPIWALIALDSGGYDIPVNSEAKTQATREMYVDRILACQLSDGGFSLFGGTAAAGLADSTSDPDITGMALQALAKYRDREDVKGVINQALDCLSDMQNADGGYSSWKTDNSESIVQVLVALAELDIPLDDPRFVKNGHTLLDNIMTYYRPGNGFYHTNNGSGSNMMATEQCFYGLVAAKRASEGKNSLYRMGDAIRIADLPADEANQIGLPGKHQDVQVMAIANPGKTFADISAHKNQSAIEALAARGIISGKDDDSFEPDTTMTRAEFATIVVRGLGLKIKDAGVFEDVLPTDWFFPYVNTAYSYSIVSGISDTAFNPSGTITRQEAAAMVTRAAKLCGMDTDMGTAQIRDVLAGFTDYVKTGQWAMASLAFCYDKNILPNEDIEIMPEAPITRAQIAQMLFNMLGAAKLLY